jgi:hypothetical protein
MTLSRRDSVKSALALAAGALVATHGDGAAEPETGVAVSPASALPSGPEDYELTVWVRYDLQNYDPRRTGDASTATYGEFVVEAGREDGAWRMRVQQVLVEDDEGGESVSGPDLLDVRDQVDGPDPLALLQGLLAGHVVMDGSRVIRTLSQRQIAALHVLPPDLRAELIGLMQRNDNDTFAHWFGRWALTATGEDFDGLFHTDAYYMELAARVRAENVPGKLAAQERDRFLAMAAALDRIATD